MLIHDWVVAGSEEQEGYFHIIQSMNAAGFVVIFGFVIVAPKFAGDGIIQVG